jgi:hypothetical protein
MMLKFGPHIKVVSETLGHSLVDLTLNTYSHLIPGLQDVAISNLNQGLYERTTIHSGTSGELLTVNELNM